MATEQKGLVAGNAQNKAGGVTPRSRSTFPLSYSFFETERFADLTPFFVAEGVSADRLPLHSNHEVQTYTLKSPILQDLLKKKDYFMVPMQAILPNNWEKFYTNPNIGQDVPANCGCGVADFWSQVASIFGKDVTILGTYFSNASATPAGALDRLFHFLLFYEMFYSAGSLMETLGISGHNYFRALYTESGSPSQVVTFDEIFDAFISTIVSQMVDSSVHLSFIFTLGSDAYRVVPNPTDDSGSSASQTYQAISIREALELMRDDLSFQITVVTADSTLDATWVDSVLDGLWSKFGFDLPSTDAPLNTARLWAYQLVQAHFYTNDHVDFIYSAELYRQYVNELVTRKIGGGNQNIISRTFNVNGLEYVYDSLSALYTSRVLLAIADGILATYNPASGTYYPDTLNDCLAYFVAMLQFKKSLRFMDYFTGSRAYPLAMTSGTMGAGVMSSSYTISGNTIDIVELSKHSKATQFLQAVNRSGRKFSAYMKELFGIVPKFDFHNPMYLAHTSDLVGSPQTENTGADQLTKDNSVTSRFRATSSRYAFEFQPDRDCIVIGISYYDLPRVYARATERQNFYLDRFDMFNPFLQYTGDQGIYEAEIGTDTPLVGSYFSYTNKDMQYKQRFNQCCGGFCVPSTNLDHWLFIADKLRRRQFHHISPSFIRSFNSEIDDFFVNLTGYSLGTYFHFITRYDNRMVASRPMAYAPSIEV